jgi:protein-S-isoprenylcysteine O-methyltransferase Ste14
VIGHGIPALLTASVLVLQFLVDRGENPYLRGAGVACLILSPLFIFPPFLLLRRYGRPSSGEPYHDTSIVVDRGLYAIVRHPQYLGYILLGLGFAGLSQHIIVWVPGILAAIAFLVLARREEATCRRTLGEAYAEYMERVPGFNVLLGLLRYFQRFSTRHS